MKIIFMGTPAFAVTSLQALIASGCNIVAVVTAPDKPAGRGQQLHQSEVKKFALNNNLLVLQPVKLKDEVFISQLKELQADLQIVVAFRMLPEIVWNMPRLGTYNLHGSLLPKYRGAAPINWALINGEVETGVTTFKLKHEVDTGNVLFREKVLIKETTTAGELHDELMMVGARLLVKTVSAIKESEEKKSELKFIPQLEEEVCHAPKIFKESCRINWQHSAKDIYNLIRGLSPLPAAFTILLKNESSTPQSVKVFLASYSVGNENLTNGSVLTDNKTFIKVVCADGLLELKDLQLEGKKRLQVADFLKGYKIEESTRFF